MLNNSVAPVCYLKKTKSTPQPCLKINIYITCHYIGATQKKRKKNQSELGFEPKTFDIFKVRILRLKSVRGKNGLITAMVL